MLLIPLVLRMLYGVLVSIQIWLSDKLIVFMAWPSLQSS